MNKKLIALLLTLSMVLALTACGKKEETKAPEAETPNTEVEVPEAEVPVVPGVEDVVIEQEDVDPEAGVPAAPAEEENVPAAMPEVTPEMPAVTPEMPEVENGEQTETAPETPSVPEAAPAGSVDLIAYYENVASTITDWPAMMMGEGEMLDAFYPGLTSIATKQCAVFMPMMSAVACEIALVEVENAADVQAVKDIFQSRISYQVGDENNPGGAWYPETIEGWKNNSRIVANGNCVMMIAFSECETFVSEFNALFA